MKTLWLTGGSGIPVALIEAFISLIVVLASFIFGKRIKRKWVVEISLTRRRGSNLFDYITPELGLELAALMHHLKIDSFKA